MYLEFNPEYTLDENFIVLALNFNLKYNPELKNEYKQVQAALESGASLRYIYTLYAYDLKAIAESMASRLNYAHQLSMLPLPADSMITSPYIKSMITRQLANGSENINSTYKLLLTIFSGKLTQVTSSEVAILQPLIKAFVNYSSLVSVVNVLTRLLAYGAHCDVLAGSKQITDQELRLIKKFWDTISII